MMKVGSVVQFKQPDSGQVMDGVVNKVNDNSTYTVVFNDGDERTLRRNQLCLKGDKHFDVSETLDNLPLSNPEHFGTPVLKSKKAARGRTGDSESEKEESSSEDESPRRAAYKSRHQELVGKVMLAEVADKRKGASTPVLVVLPDAHPVELKNRDQLLVRSFRDTKFMAVNRKDLKEFSREAAIKNEDKALKAAFEKALLYFDGSELPTNWNREELLGPDDDDGEEEDESSDDEEQCEERDRFVAQLYKFMDDRATPINKGPCIGNKDLNLYRLFRVVQNLGGYNKVTNQMKWRLVYSKMGLPPSNTAAHQIKNAYKKYLHAFEDFYRKLGCIMGTISRPGRQSRQTPSRGILSFRGRDKDSSPRSPRTEKAAPKEDKTKEEEKAKAKPEKPEESSTTEETSESTAQEEADSDVTRRSTPRREKAQKEEPKLEKKDELKTSKEEEKKEELPREEKKKEEKREERKSLRQSQKDREDEKKDAVRMKEEEKKEVKKEEGKTDRVLRKDLNDKEEEEKKEPEDPKEAQKKRVSRRKSARVEEEKKESDEKEDEEEKEEEKRKDKKPPASAKKEKAAPKKKAEEEESETKDKESGNESEDDSPSSSTQDQEVLSLGTRLKVRYGRGRNHKIYEAKVIEYRTTDPHKKYRVHYAGWNTRYDEWVETERIVKVVDKPEMAKLKKKPLTAKSLKASAPQPAATKAETPSHIKKRGRQSSTQQVLTPGGTTTPKPPSTPVAAEAKTPKSKVPSTGSPSVSKTRSMRSNSTEIKPEAPVTSATKHRITRRSSGINESPDEPVTGDVEGGSESDIEVDPSPVVPVETDSISEHQEEEEPKEMELDAGVEEIEEPLPSVQPATELKSTLPPQEEEPAVVKAEDLKLKQPESKLKQPAVDTEPVSEIVSQEGTDSSKEMELQLPPPPPPPPPSAPVDSFVTIKDNKKQTIPDPPSEPEETKQAEVALVTEEVKDVPKVEERAPELVSVQEEEEVQEEKKAEEEKTAHIFCTEASPVVVKQEVEKAAPLDDPAIPQLKKIELDLPPAEDKKDSKEKERLKPGKKLGRDFKKSRQNEMRTSFSEIPTLEPMTSPPSDVKPAPVDVAPSPYDFNDTEADSPSPWQPEITKKWDPSNKPLPIFQRDVKKDVKKELKKSLETEKKKVKKKTKKVTEEQGGEGDSPTKPSEKKAKDPSLVKKGRKKRVADGEVKVDTSSYEETVNSVVESCKNDDMTHLSLPLPPPSEPKEEKPAKKRKKIFPASAALESEAAQEEKKEPAKPVKSLKGKVGRKKKEIKAPDSVTEPHADPLPVSVPALDVHVPPAILHHEKLPSTEPCEPVPVKEACSDGDLPSASALGGSPQGLVVSAPKAGPSGLQVLSMASIRPVPSTSGAAGGGPSDRLVPLLEGVREVVKQAAVLEPRVDCAGDMPKASCSVGNTVLDNTPPTTPENDLDEANSASSSSEGHDNLKEDLDSLDSVERTCKGGSESPPGCDFSLSSTSSENLPSSSSGVQSNGQPSQSLDTVGTKRKKKDDAAAAAKKKKRLISRSTRGERNKKSPKYGDDDSQSRSPLHQNTTDSGLVSSGHGDATKSSTPRPPKFHFADDLGEHLQGEQRIQFLLDKMKEVRKVYQGIKAEVAAIDRKRKRARRREKERESSQASTGDREAS
ncbi:uncharacterized protein LOC143296465 isoform X2 [Babylonia areolata]